MKFGASFKFKYWLADRHLQVTGHTPVATRGTDRTGICGKMCESKFQLLKQKLARLQRANFEYFMIFVQGGGNLPPYPYEGLNDRFCETQFSRPM